MAAKRYKRRTYILTNTSQTKYIFSYFALFCLGLLVFSSLFSFMSMDTTTIIYDKSEIRVGSTPNMLVNQMLGSGWVIILIGGSLLFVLSTIMTHRVAGPAYRIEESLKKMLRGEFGFKIILRKNDEMKPIAHKLETLSMQIEQWEADIKKHQDEMMRAIKGMDLDETDRNFLLAKIKDIEKSRPWPHNPKKMQDTA
ncbi:hypothetical protein LZ24_02577 [Desulfobotulus alkaliphilus]|uniref:HAMP domain-containing protein n=1 Tax=Desulfobotulus alkaliphilus TaxID=622671 RepID=A0A562RH20_9BACT|nr:hypothetical protein [Desulfobotulus alkaliphilus]TWI68203.1 hypothetical protein LZ24_02577 [Desulfobotulus alkaliphilus]